MGTKCSDEKNNNDAITDYEYAIFNQKRQKVFYGTIAICVLYAVIAIVLLILANLSEKIKFLLLNNFLPFTIVFIVGTILIVAFLMNQVINFKPYKIDKNSRYDNLSCPDYWNLEKVPNLNDSNSLNTFNSLFDSNINRNFFKYRCVMNNKVFDKYNIFANNSNLYSFTNLRDSNNNKPGLINDVNEITSLYANVLSNNTYDANKNIFKYNSNLHLKYEFIKNNLVMNNYTIINNANADPIIFKLNENLVNMYDQFKINSNMYYTTPGTAYTYGKHMYISVSKDGNTVKGGNTNPPTTTINELPLICDSFYPLYMANSDEYTNSLNNKYDNNVFRCAYSKICKVPWSDMNCDIYKDQ